MWDGKDNQKIQRRVTEKTVNISQAMLNPQMQEFNHLDEESKRDLVIDILVALTFSQAVLAMKFLKVTPEEFGNKMGNFLRDNMIALKDMRKEQEDGTGTSAEEGSDWD